MICRAAPGSSAGPRTRAVVQAVRSIVMSTRRSRWTRLLVLAIVVGALLLMHGLDAHVGGPQPSEAAAAASVVADHPRDESTPGDHGHCVDCVAAHVMAACVAIITAIGGVALLRRLLRGTLEAPVAAVAGRVRGLVDMARPPDPAWVRLSVMRC